MFESARLKIDRAKRHVGDLQATLDRYAQAAPVKFNPDGRFAVVKLDPKVATDCGLIIGDAVHNFHSALDHAFWELMEIDGGHQGKSTKFPIHSDGDRGSYEGSIKGIIARPDTQAFFVKLGAYKGGPGNVLCALHSCDIVDKHAVLTPVLGVTSLQNCVVVQPNGSREVWTVSDMFEEFARPDGRAVIRPYGNARFEIDPNAKATLSIHFGDIDFVKLQPVNQVLGSFGLGVTRAINGLERVLLDRA